MKPYANLNGKAKWSLFWGDKTNKKIKKVFKKSARQEAKRKVKKDFPLTSHSKPPIPTSDL